MRENEKTALVRIIKQRGKALQVTDGEWVTWMPVSLCRREGWLDDIAEVPLGLAQRNGLFTSPHWEPVKSTRDATLWLVREFGYGSDRVEKWLKAHEAQLRVWLRRREKLMERGG